ncbi:MAG TPA: hypothetical protein VGD07_20760 [Methylomirabilota bacterium]
MTRAPRALAAVVALVLLTALDASAQRRPFLQVLLEVAGISATPSALRGPGDELEDGDVWMAGPGERTQVRLTRDGGYRSPVFAPGDRTLLALRRSVLVEVPATGGDARALHALVRPSKLVGLSRDRPHEVLALFEDAGGLPWLGLVALASGQVTPVPHDRASREHRAMIAHVKDWERVYGGTTVYVKAETTQGLAGAVEWTDVYVTRGGDPVNVSRCDGVRCGQPALSHDGRHVAFVKATR